LCSTTLLSELNSRKIVEVNVFERIHESPIFISILAATVVIQAGGVLLKE